MDTEQEALYFLRKLAYLLYLEIGALRPQVHAQVAQKAKLNTAFFQRDKERQAATLYHQVENETDPDKILGPFEERTGLSLPDLTLAFQKGDWRNKFGGVNFGGAKWAAISEATEELYQAIKQGEWDEAADVVRSIKTMKTNQGYLINQFERTERRR